jgi:anti-sigma regulatory factor (Ser/Thr protein kinase)
MFIIKKQKMNATATKLNALQLHFLKYLSEFDVSDQEANDIKKIVSNYYFDKAQHAIDQAVEAKSIDIKALEIEGNLHYRTKKQ